MNDEIKEILDILEGRKNWYLHQQKNNSAFNDEDYIAYMVLDYITNLQQKIKHYEETTTFGDYVKEVNLLVDYKSRIEKAIEYMQENKRISLDDTTSIINFYNNLFNILRGDKDV